MKPSKRVQEAQERREAFLEKYRTLRVPIPEEEFYLLESGADEEYTVAIIRKYLLTDPHRHWLFGQNISIEDVLNGRVEGGRPPEVTEMFRDWNEKLGGKYFFE